MLVANAQLLQVMMFLKIITLSTPTDVYRQLWVSQAYIVVSAQIPVVVLQDTGVSQFLLLKGKLSL